MTFMIFMILTGSAAFSEILAYTGATTNLVELAGHSQLSPYVLVIMMQIVMLFMGCFMEPLSILMVTMPIFMPIILSIGLDPICFGVISLVNMETAVITPPFGLSLFVMKGVAPAGTTLWEIYLSSAPWVILNIVTMGLLLAFPMIALWLPSFM